MVICDVKDCSTATEALSAKHSNGNVFYTECDAESCRKLGTFAKEKLGKIGQSFDCDLEDRGADGGHQSRQPLSADHRQINLTRRGASESSGPMGGFYHGDGCPVIEND